MSEDLASGSRTTSRRVKKVVNYAALETAADLDEELLLSDEEERVTTKKQKASSYAGHRNSGGYDDQEGVATVNNVYGQDYYTEPGYEHELPIRLRFTFEPEYEGDGTLKMDKIVGRRPVKKEVSETGRDWNGCCS